MARTKKTAAAAVVAFDESLLSEARRKIENFHKICDRNLVERKEETRMMTTGLVSGCNALLVGAPGTAKSLLCDAVTNLIGGNRPFRKLLTRHTTPDELFGPISLEAFKNEEYRHNTTGYLPEAQVAFLDEIWKASSAILNNLLQIINEGTYTNGNVTAKVPLKIVVAASNEYPSMGASSSLMAMYDRFLIRKNVHEVTSSRGIKHIMFSDIDLTIDPADQMTEAELIELRKQADNATWSDSAKTMIETAITNCHKEGIMPSARRLRKARAACQANAAIAGRSHVERADLDILAHILWVDPEKSRVVADIVDDLCDPNEKEVREIQKARTEVLAAFKALDPKKEDPNTVVAAAHEALAKIDRLQKRAEAVKDADLAKSLSDDAVDLEKSAQENLLLLFNK